MSTVTISRITEYLRDLPADKLMVVYDFISYLVAKENGRMPALSSGNDAPFAVIVPVAEYERLVARQRRNAAFHEFAYHFGQEVEERGSSEEEFMADLEATKREVFSEQYGRSTVSSKSES